MAQSYLRTVQETIDSMDVGVGANHHSMWRNSCQVTVSVLRHLSAGALSTQQLKVLRLQVRGPRLARVTCPDAQCPSKTSYLKLWNPQRGRFRFLTISVLENGGVFDESHISISLCQTPGNNKFGFTKISQMHRCDVINDVLQGTCDGLQKCFKVF